jgi:F-type H+-transporting ATPase subunit b
MNMVMDETFWTAAAFALFILAVHRPVGRVLASMLDERAKRIQEELDEAVRLREEAQALLASFQHKQRDAMQEAEEIIEHAKQEALSLTKEAEQAVEDAMSRRMKATMEKIDVAEANMIQEIRTHSIDLAFKAANDMIEKNADKKTSEAMFKQALKAMPKKLH